MKLIKVIGGGMIALSLTSAICFTSLSHAQTCTGETGECSGGHRVGLALSLGSKNDNTISLVNEPAHYLSQRIFNSIKTEHADVRVEKLGWDQMVIKEIKGLVSCSQVLRSGSSARCTFTGPKLSERVNLTNELPAKLTKTSAARLNAVGGNLTVLSNGLEYFCTSSSDCFVQIKKSAFPGGVF